MASNLAFVQKPVNTSSQVPVITNWTPLIGYMVYQSDATTASYFFYKIILEVRLTDASGTLLAKIKQRRNGYSADVTANKARAFFDIREIVNTQLVNTLLDQYVTDSTDATLYKTIHKVGANTASRPFSLNGDALNGKTQIEQIYVKAYQQYSTTETGAIQEVTSDTINDTLFYLQATLPLFTARSTDNAYIQSDAFNSYHQGGSGDLFLSKVSLSSGDVVGGSVLRNYLLSSDYHTVSFLNDNSNFGSNVKYIEIVYYNSAGVQINNKEYIQNVASNGGIAPDDGSLTDAGRLIYFGCGTANLEAQSDNTDARPSNNSGYAYYTIRGTSNNTGTISYVTTTYYFILQDSSCKGFKVRRLAWSNSVGGYDYFNFKFKSSQTVEISRNNYSTVLGNFSQQDYSYYNTGRGKTTKNTTAILKETLNTDYITEAQADLLEDLLKSNNVHIVENADTTYTQAVVITDSSFVRKTVANDKLIQYTIQIEYANPLNTNN